MLKRCKHNWKVLTETKEKSPIEKMVEVGVFRYRGFEDIEYGKYICIVTCIKCGKIKKFVETI